MTGAHTKRLWCHDWRPRLFCVAVVHATQAPHRSQTTRCHSGQEGTEIWSTNESEPIEWKFLCAKRCTLWSWVVSENPMKQNNQIWAAFHELSKANVFGKLLHRNVLKWDLSGLIARMGKMLLESEKCFQLKILFGFCFWILDEHPKTPGNLWISPNFTGICWIWIWWDLKSKIWCRCCVKHDQYSVWMTVAGTLQPSELSSTMAVEVRRRTNDVEDDLVREREFLFRPSAMLQKPLWRREIFKFYLFVLTRNIAKRIALPHDPCLGSNGTLTVTGTATPSDAIVDKPCNLTTNYIPIH